MVGYSLNGVSGSAGVSLISESVIRDIKLVLVSFIVTCIIIAAYNYSLQQRVLRSSDKTKSESKGDTRSLRPLTARKGGLKHGLSYREQGGSWVSGDFLSVLLAQIWHHTNIAVSNCIKEMLTPILEDLKVPIHFIKLDLGEVPIKTSNMYIHTVKSKDQRSQQRIQIDFDLLWDGECDILLQATLSKGLKLTFGVQHIKLKGRFSLVLGPLTTDLPVVSAVQYGFTNPPEISLSYAGCVKSLSDKLSFVDGALKSAIDTTLAGMLVLPYRMNMPIDLGTYDYLETYTPPEGMLRISVKSGRGFHVLKKMLVNDIPDVYCNVSLGASKPFRNSTKYDNLNPTWKGETQDFILYDWDQKIYVNVYDEDKSPMDPDDLLGKAEITAKDLFDKDGEAELALTMDGKPTDAFVTVGAEMFYLTKKPSSFSLPEFDGKNKLCGLLTVIVTKAFDIPLPKEDCATMVKVVYGKGCTHEETFWTGTVADYPGIDALNPMFDMSFHVPLTSEMLDSDIEDAAIVLPQSRGESPPKFSPNKNLRSSVRNSFIGMISRSPDKKDSSLVELTLIDGDGANGTKGHGELGSIVISHRDIMEAHNHCITETRAIGNDGARLEFKVFISGIQSGEESDDSDIDDIDASEIDINIANDSIKETQTVLLTALRGRGFEIHKRGFGKKDDVPDIYLSVPQFNWKTSVCKDDTMPQWNESKLLSVTNVAKKIRVDAYDKNSKSKDEHIGTAKFRLDQLLRKRTMEIELKDDSGCTGSFVTMQCVARAAQDNDNESNGDGLGPLLSASAPSSFSPFNIELEKAANDEDQSIAGQTINSNISMSSTFSRRKLLRTKSLPSPKLIAQSVTSFKRGKKKLSSPSATEDKHS